VDEQEPRPLRPQQGLCGARDEFHLAAIVQNLKTMTLRLVGPPAARHARRLRKWNGKPKSCSPTSRDAQPGASENAPPTASDLRQRIFRQHRPHADSLEAVQRGTRKSLRC
jgi:hypothetical protein